MDPHQSATESNFDVDSSQNQEMLTNSEEKDKRECPESREQETNPLKITIILEKIFGFLDPDSIKNARLVNELWSAEGAKILFTKTFVRLASRLLGKDSPKKQLATDKFKAFLAYKSNKMSMIPNITVEDPQDIEVWKSLGVLGPQVQGLWLKISDDDGILLQNLLDLLPNLQYLNLKQSLFSRKGQSAIIKVVTSVMSSKAEKDKNSLVISQLILEPDNLEQFEELEKFSDAGNIKIEKLKVAIPPKFFSSVLNCEGRIASILAKLMFSSQHTLERIALDNYELYLSLLEFPQMTLLSFLALSCCDIEAETSGLLRRFRFPKSFQFSKNTPNLKYIAVIYQGEGPERGFAKKLFKGTGIAPSVKRLLFSDNVNKYLIDRLLILFPNLEDLKMTTTECSKEVFHSIWKHGRCLKKLDITIDVDLEYHDLCNLDYYFSGFLPWTVEMLKKHPNWISYTIEDLEKLRVKPSIMNLQELEELRICFGGDDWDRKLPKRMLDVTGEYAFKLMPELALIVIKTSLSGSVAAFDGVSKLPNVFVIE